jgi:hypothetical protein
MCDNYGFSLRTLENNGSVAVGTGVWGESPYVAARCRTAS